MATKLELRTEINHNSIELPKSAPKPAVPAQQLSQAEVCELAIKAIHVGYRPSVREIQATVSDTGQNQGILSSLFSGLRALRLI